VATDLGPVLVVEDDESTSHGLIEVLLLAKIRAVGAPNGAVALEKLISGLRPCVIVLDLGLPVMSGQQFLKAKLLEPEIAAIPIIVVTGLPTEGEDFASLNVKAVFSKPIDPWKVVEIVRKYCRPMA
jgi:DNA-binding response OmpR family regulator